MEFLSYLFSTVLLVWASIYLVRKRDKKLIATLEEILKSRKNHKVIDEFHETAYKRCIDDIKLLLGRTND